MDNNTFLNLYAIPFMGFVNKVIMNLLQAKILNSYKIDDLDNPDTTEILEMTFDSETRDQYIREYELKD